MMTPDQLRQNIDTIVVVMMENRSFDTVLGHMRHPDFGNRTDIDGIDDLDNSAFVNNNVAGQGIRPFWRPDAPTLTDLPHGKQEVADSLLWAPVAQKYSMNGFVSAFENAFQVFVHDPPVMGILRPADLPTTSPLARQYTVCDRWFACLPTSTAPNRLMSMCGATEIDETNLLVPDQPNVYDWLSSLGVGWRVYHAGLPFLTLMPKVLPLLLTSHFRGIGDLQDDWINEPTALRPHVIFVEPDYHDSPIHFESPCDNHPPLSMAPGEAFLARVYNALTSDAHRWARTLLLITYDEHGGLWDHVSPPKIAYRNVSAGVSFDSMGPRTPTIVAGPFAPAGRVALDGANNKPLLDNTSILQLLAERFGTMATSYSPEVLLRKHQGVASVSSILDASGANTARCTFGNANAVAGPPPSLHPSILQQGFDASIKQLLLRHGSEALAKFPQLQGYPQ